MTTPRVTTKYVKGDRFYIHENTGKQVPGVSGIKSMLPAPALFNWAKSATAIYAVDHLDAIGAVAATDRDAAVELVKNTTTRHSKKAADRGTEVHGMCEQIMIDRLNGRKSSFHASKDDMLYLRNFARFVTEFDVQPEMVETTIWSQEHNYAGTFDLLCRLRGYEGLSIVDYKTGASGVYPDAGIQQTAYVHADSYIDDEGEFQQLPTIERAFGLWLRPDGYALYPLRTDEYMWAVFLHLREIFDYVKNGSATVVGKPVNNNPLKKRWRGKK